MEFLQFWDQHRGSFSRISAAGWSLSYAPANRSWSGPLQNLGSGAPMSTICWTFSQIASPRPCVWTRVINLSQQSNRFLYLEIIHVSDQLRSNQITMIFRVLSLMYHSSSNIYHESLIIQQLPCIISHLSPVIHHLSSGFMLHDFDYDYDYDYGHDYDYDYDYDDDDGVISSSWGPQSC